MTGRRSAPRHADLASLLDSADVDHATLVDQVGVERVELYLQTVDLRAQRLTLVGEEVPALQGLVACGDEDLRAVLLERARQRVGQARRSFGGVRLVALGHGSTRLPQREARRGQQRDQPGQQHLDEQAVLRRVLQLLRALGRGGDDLFDVPAPVLRDGP